MNKIAQLTEIYLPVRKLTYYKDKKIESDGPKMKTEESTIVQWHTLFHKI